MKDIGIGVIGLGMGMGAVALNEDNASRLEVRSICCKTEEKVKSIAGKWRIKHWTTDYRKLVERDDIDAVAVYSPDHLHYEHCSAALRAGKHVMCTKPLTNDLEQAQKLVQLVNETKLKFFVGQSMRFSPQTTAARQFFDDGQIGTIIFAEAHYVHDIRPIFEMTPWRLHAPQDFMYGGISHPADILRWFVGDVEELHAFGGKGGLSAGYPLMDNFTINLKFINGTIGRILGLFGVIEPSEPAAKLALYGTKMNVTATFSDLSGQLETVWDKIEYRPVSTMTFPPEEGIDVYNHSKTLLRYMAHFEDCIVNDKEPSPNIIDGAKTIAIGHAAWQSIKEERVVKVLNDF